MKICDALELNNDFAGVMVNLASSMNSHLLTTFITSLACIKSLITGKLVKATFELKTQ
jgi:hypothetical protein